MTNSIKIKPEVKRDRWGRYQLPHPQGEKEKGKVVASAHTRVTTIAGTIENKWHLEAWKNRMIVIGLLQRKDLYANAAAMLASGEPSDSPDNKKRFNDLCEEAFKAAGGGERASIGTSLHTFSEMLDAGLKPAVPEPWDKDLIVYEETIKAKHIKHTEVEVICVKWGSWAGTADRFSTIGSHPLAHINDLKTGSDVVKFAAGAIAMQLSMYADSDYIFDPATNKYRDMPELNKQHGLVMHLPAGEARCTLYWVDLNKGRHGTKLALAVRAWREEKGGPLTAWTDDVPLDALAARRESFLTRVATIKELGGLDLLRKRWPADIPTLKQGGEHTSEQLDKIDHVLMLIEKQLQCPLPNPDNGAARHLKLVKEVKENGN